jgi:esterase FrsA
MNDVSELKQFAVLHARAQSIPRYRELLDVIRTDEDGVPGSWAWEWGRAADLRLNAGHVLDASRLYAMARFPYVDGTARRHASVSCVSTFDRWRRAETDIQRLEIVLPGGRVRCWASGLSATKRLPLLLAMGGIVSVKEQWAPVLVHARRFGMAGIVTEMPGVGENTLRYEAESWRMISGLLDTVRDLADVAQTYAVAQSFGGHLAMRCAVDDPRIRGIVTVGAPVSGFFTNTVWQGTLPRITVDTLTHLTGVKSADLSSHLRHFALTADQLDGLTIPVCYLASRRDEIIPGSEVSLLKKHVRDLRLVENDDVHGSPHHVTESRVWTILSVLRMRDVHRPQRAVLGSLWHTLRAFQRLARATA